MTFGNIDFSIIGPALVAGGLATVDLASVFAVSRLLSETLFAFLLVLSVALVLRALKQGRISRTVRSGPEAAARSHQNDLLTYVVCGMGCRPARS